MNSPVIEWRYHAGQTRMQFTFAVPVAVATPIHPVYQSSLYHMSMPTSSGCGTSRFAQSLMAEAYSVLPLRVKSYSFQQPEAVGEVEPAATGSAASATGAATAAAAARPAVRSSRGSTYDADLARPSRRANPLVPGREET
jgi:hypothetical protein